MTPQEVARVLALVSAGWPAQRQARDEEAVYVWGLSIGEATYEEARTAVALLLRRGEQWCSPGAVRREIARSRNALTPDAATLLDDVLTVARADGLGFTLLHPVAQRVYRKWGGASGVRALPASQVERMSRDLERETSAHDERTLCANLPAPAPPHEPVAAATRALSAQQRPAIEPADGYVPMPENVRAGLAEIARRQSVDEHTEGSH